MAGLDASPLGLLSAEVMERVTEQFGEDAVLRIALVIVEVEGEEDSQILVASNEARPWVQLAFLDEGRIAVERQLAVLEGEEP